MILKDFDASKKEGWGRPREKEERNPFSQNLERESVVKNEEKWPLWPFIATCSFLPLLPSP
jgi:hypothetical protein